MEAAAETGLPVSLMHMQGNPKTMQEAPKYDDVFAEVNRYFIEQIARCEKAGIAKEKLLLDPGFGFGKNLSHNYTLLARLGEFHHFNLPLLVGMSRKTMVGQLLNVGPSDRLNGSLACAVIAAMQGAQIIRVHDVKETVEAMRVVEATLSAKETNAMSNRKYFGTDGIRGRVGNAPLHLISCLNWVGLPEKCWRVMARVKSLSVKIRVFPAICWSPRWRRALPLRDCRPRLPDLCQRQPSPI